MSKPRKIPPLVREKWLLDELSPAARASFERNVPEAERDALRSDDQALQAQLLAELPASRLKALVASKVAVQEKPTRMRLWPITIPALGVALASLLFLVRPSERSLPGTEEPVEAGERSKGLSPRVVIFRQLAQRAEELRNGSEVRTHDVLQLGYVAGGRPFGVLVSIDGRGLVTLHAPELPNAEAYLAPNPKTQLLERAYELDDAPNFERFFFVTSAEALRVHDVLNAAKQLAQQPERAMREQLKLGPNIEQSSVLLRKASAP